MLKYAAAIVLATATAANAQQCAPLDVVNESLQERFGERLVTMGTANRGQNVVSQYANEETGTWTILIINAQGVACLVASGDNWSAIAAPPVGDPA